jgi:signal transduction histidine kinase
LNAADIVDNVLASTGGLIRAAQFTVECDVDPSLPPVVGDRLAVSQCLENLVTNALKYGNEARWLKLRTRLAPDNSAVEISVSDRGIGIASGDLTRIFEPFYRSRSVRVAQISGTGLGLAVARQIAQAMGGTLTVESEFERGSTFTLRLRLYDETDAIASVSPRAVIQS